MDDKNTDKNQINENIEIETDQVNIDENIDSEQVIPKSEYDKLFDSYSRLLAEIVNQKKNADLDKQKNKQSILLKIINIIDTYEIVLTNTDTSNELYLTLENLLQQLNIILATEGVKKFELKEGEDFDSNTAEVVSTQIGEIDGKVLAVLSHPYKIGDNILRVGKVIVTRTN